MMMRGLFRVIYPELLNTVMQQGYLQENKRTGHSVRVVDEGVCFTLVDHLNYTMPLCGVRRLRPGTAAAEVAWFLQGTQDVRILQDMNCRIWDKFVEEDKVTVEAAYGYRWRVHFERDQIALAVKTLQDDPSSRQVYVSAWDPSRDGLGNTGKNIPCPASFTFAIVNGSLMSSLFIRSSDVFVGLPYDVMGHSILMGLMANTLGVKVGTMTVMLAHAHVYDSHWPLVELLRMQPSPPTTLVPLPPRQFTISSVELGPLDLVRWYRDVQNKVEWPKFDPWPEVVL